jgi:hypothetical protein
MKDMEAHLEKPRADAAECALISNLATDMQKRELFARLSEHLQVLASEVERAIAAKMLAENRKAAAISGGTRLEPRRHVRVEQLGASEWKTCCWREGFNPDQITAVTRDGPSA